MGHHKILMILLTWVWNLQGSWSIWLARNEKLKMAAQSSYFLSKPRGVVNWISVAVFCFAPVYLVAFQPLAVACN
jgi:hypothetical protein